LLERLRTRGIGQRPNGTRVTASYGVAERVTDCILDSQRLIELADKRMYLAKRSGKDRWVSCEDDPVPLSDKSCQI
jgi:PleD family two-component response regulator